MRVGWAVGAGSLAALLALAPAGCGPDSSAARRGPDPAQDVDAGRPVEREGGPRPAAPDPSWTTGTVSRPATVETAVALLADLRAGAHEGYERVTLDLGGEGTGFPAFTAAYVDRPLHECGSGNEIHPIGGAWLELRLEPLDAHTQAGKPTVSHAPRDLPGLDVVRRVYMTCDFEAVVTLAFALTSPNRFRVFTLEDPRRIVLDVETGR